MEEVKLTRTEFTKEQLAKLKALQECENPKPRNREERRLQEKQNKKNKKIVFNNH